MFGVEATSIQQQHEKLQGCSPGPVKLWTEIYLGGKVLCCVESVSIQVWSLANWRLRLSNIDVSNHKGNK